LKSLPYDNVSGVAVAPALANRLVGCHHRYDLRFEFLAQRGAPFLSEPGNGLGHARACRRRGDSIGAMLSLESRRADRPEPLGRSDGY
jgi:hypothetical protein